MLPALRTAFLAAALCTAVALPAVAQTATPAPSAEASKPATEKAVKDLEATVQGLKRDMQKMSEAARKGASDVLNRTEPYVIPSQQLMAIGVGVVAGAVIVDVLGGGGLATLVGAAVGGYAGNWFYTTPAAPAAPAAKGG